MRKNFTKTTIQDTKNDPWGFSWVNLDGINFSWSHLYNPIFYSSTLIETSFFGAHFYIDNGEQQKVFNNIKWMKNVDFRNTKVFIRKSANSYTEDNRWIKGLLDGTQYKNIITTDEQYKTFLEEKNKQQEEELKSTSEGQTNSLLSGFKDLATEYHFEEKFWIRCMALIAFYLLFLSSLPLLIFLYSYSNIIVIPTFLFFCLYLHLLENPEESKTEKIEKITPWIIFTVFIFLAWIWVIPNIEITEKTNLYIYISPIIILFITLLYFSVTQYSKSKKLRIDNQNKIALIHGMMAIKADTTNMNKWRFYDKIAEIVFDKVHHDKEENLPIDKIIQIIKATNWQK